MRSKKVALTVGCGAFTLLLLLQLIGWEQRHFSTLVAVLGSQRETYRQNRHAVVWHHGWPMTFVERSGTFADVYPGEEPWDAGRWAISSGVVRWHPGALAINVGLCGAFAATVGWITWRISFSEIHSSPRPPGR